VGAGNFDAHFIVNQDGERMVVDEGEAPNFEGFLTSENSFVVSKRQVVPCKNAGTGESTSTRAIIMRTLEFSNVTKKTVDVQQQEELISNCPGNRLWPCPISWHGQLSRTL
jgi:hypothetical protein